MRRTRAAVGIALVAVAFAAFVVERGGTGQIRTVEILQTAPCRIDRDRSTVSAPFVATGAIRGGSRRLGARLTVFGDRDLTEPLAAQVRKVAVSGTFTRTFSVSVQLAGPAPDTVACLYRLER